MKKKNNQNNEPVQNLVHFDSYEETVIRENNPEKEAIRKAIRKKFAFRKAKQIISLVSAFAVLVSAFFLGKRGFESYLVFSQEQKEDEYVLPKEVTKELENMTEEEAWAYLYEKYPHLLDIVFPVGFDYHYALYYAENPDTIGYIKIPGTEVDTPVVQADNNKYYLEQNRKISYPVYRTVRIRAALIKIEYNPCQRVSEYYQRVYGADNSISGVCTYNTVIVVHVLEDLMEHYHSDHRCG
jgi:hypothetical protein